MQTNLFEFLSPKYTITKPIRLIELFGGIGAQAKALENIGADFEHWFMCEIDSHAVDSYNAIHRTDFKPLDICNVHAPDLRIVDTDKFTYLLTYSFPCTSISIAGKMDGYTEGSGTASSLLFEVKRLLEECETLPQLLLMENVPQVCSDRNKDNWRQWMSFLESKGYSNYAQIMNACDYGIPQNRVRMFMVSILGDYSFTFPKKQNLEVKMKDLLEKNPNEKYYLSNKTIDYFFKKEERTREEGNGFRFIPMDKERETSRPLLTKHTRIDGCFIKEDD